MSGVLLLAVLLGDPAPPRPAPEYKIAFWYDRGDPVRTLRSQPYDLRRGQFDADRVDAWLATIRTKHPTHVAFVRDVTLADLPGDDDAAKLRAAVARQADELLRLRAAEFPPQPARPESSAVADFLRSRPAMTGAIPTLTPTPLHSIGASGMGPGPAGRSLYPQPMPYPRPHP